MSGKVYTMKEMKNIVTYLNEHKAYGEVRGRKMWVDFANSNSTTRTWQSLKETFLKRILPDIHNPYYNLTREQIISFRQGYDVNEREKNKLEIEEVGENSNTETQNENEKHLITGEEEVLEGENDKHSNITLYNIPKQNNCYDTVDDIRRDLESPKVDEQNKSNHTNLNNNSTIEKTVVHDIATETDDTNDLIEEVSALANEDIDSVPLQGNDTDTPNPESVDNAEKVIASEDQFKVEEKSFIEEQAPSNDNDSETNKNHNREVVEKELGNDEKESEKDTSHDFLENSSMNNKDCETSGKKNEKQETAIISMTSSCQPLTNSTSDTILPNNQEGLNVETHNNSKSDNAVVSKKGSKNSRKRSSSADTVVLDNKRQKTNTKEKHKKEDQSASDMEIFYVNDSDSTRAGDKAEKTIDISSKSENGDTEPQTQNPCLKSVSLYAEQFNKTKYTDTSDENSANDDPKPSRSKQAKKVAKDDIVVLKSHTDSESDKEPPAKKRSDTIRAAKAQRAKAFAKIFGVASGGVSSSKTCKSSHNRPRRIQNTHDNEVLDSDSSEWTTDTEEDFILPPRGRTNRKTKKYLKPKSTRILSLEEEGGLFVMYGKRIYPVVKDGRIVKNYVIYESNSDSGFEQDSYWKAKYAELKKKYEDHKKSKEPSENSREKRNTSVTQEPSSPILQSSIRKPKPPVAQNQDIHAPSTSKAIALIENEDRPATNPIENKMSSEKIMIKYTTNNAEVHLEGHWPQICPIFDKMLDILPRKIEPQTEASTNKLEGTNKSEVPKQAKDVSGKSTPVIITGDSVQEKIDKLESEIFKEIEEKDKEEQEIQMEANKEEGKNVTNRKRGRPKQSSTPDIPITPNKQPRASSGKAVPIAKDTSEAVEKQGEATPIQQSPQVTTRRTRRSMKAALDAQKMEESKATQETPKPSNETPEDNIRYMFPPPSQTSSNKQKPKSFADRIIFQDVVSMISDESTQGYHDSDISPRKIKKRRKSKLSTRTYRNKIRTKRNQRTSYQYILKEASTDSSNTSFSEKCTKVSENSSEAYKSDSYRYLFQLPKKTRRLEPIHETSPIVNDVEMRPFDAVCRNQLNTDLHSDPLVHGNFETGSSSNVSLPQSPELSLVENISIGKEFLNSIATYRSFKKSQDNESNVVEGQNKYLISDVDITMPLMEQKCILQKNNTDIVMKDASVTSNRKKKPSVSESLLNKICTVNINDNSSASDSLDIQLHNLLLESAKKISKGNQCKENMEIDETTLNSMQKSKVKKRSSTPLKKKETMNSKLPPTESTVEKHMESCSYIGRTSYPPAIQVQGENGIDNTEVNAEKVQDINSKAKGRKKKDVIKVKILRPRKKSTSKELEEKSTHKSSRMSVCTDSGINGTESGVSFPNSNVSVQFIHNHSETCLHANECLDNSVEFVDASTSLISVNSNTTTEWHDSREFQDVRDLSLIALNNNVEGALACNSANCIKTYTNQRKGDEIFKSPENAEVFNSSLITEDLSDEATAPSQVARHSGWYLLSEDETSTNFEAPPIQNTGGFGSNLNQIFPVTCAIPNLSSITEISRENDSRKPFGLDSFTRDSNSQNMF